MSTFKNSSYTCNQVDCITKVGRKFDDLKQGEEIDSCTSDCSDRISTDDFKMILITMNLVLYLVDGTTRNMLCIRLSKVIQVMFVHSYSYSSCIPKTIVGKVPLVFFKYFLKFCVEQSKKSFYCTREYV